MSISVKLEVFEGPLDLLLHLIQVNQIDIFDIPIARITDQYLFIVSREVSVDMEVCSDFLVMAAVLLRIKSQMLLPVVSKEEVDEDPRTELVERLLEYQTYRYAAQRLKDLQVDAQRQLFKKKTLPEAIADTKDVPDPEKILSQVTLEKLQKIFLEEMRRTEEKIDTAHNRFGKIEKEKVDLGKQMQRIKAYAKDKGTFCFSSFFGESPGKMEKIVTFLGVLELMREGEFLVRQENIFDDIFITYKQ